MTMPALASTARKPRFIAGGPDEDEDDSQDAAPSRPRFACNAHGCPMTGSIFLASASRGVCHYHYAQNSSDWPRITQVLTDWRCITFEINDARRVLCDHDLCTDVKAQNDAHRTAWQRLEPVLVASGWAATQLAPRDGEQLGTWTRRLEEFIAAQVAAVIHHRVGGHKA
jgi:hypothetical protein